PPGPPPAVLPAQGVHAPRGRAAQPAGGPPGPGAQADRALGARRRRGRAAHLPGGGGAPDPRSGPRPLAARADHLQRPLRQHRRRLCGRAGHPP
ncbi:hypothetical protein APUTEX25_003428, partial [Auxenochlorella protothecoides]